MSTVQYDVLYERLQFGTIDHILYMHDARHTTPAHTGPVAKKFKHGTNYKAQRMTAHLS